MSGWNVADRHMATDTGTDFPAMNNITLPGILPADQIPAPSKYSINHQAPIWHLQTDSDYLFYSEIKNRG